MYLSGDPVVEEDDEEEDEEDEDEEEEDEDEEDEDEEDDDEDDDEDEEEDEDDVGTVQDSMLKEPVQLNVAWVMVLLTPAHWRPGMVPL